MRITPSHPLDRREITATPMPGARAKMAALGRRLRSLEREIASLARDVDTSRAFAIDGDANVVDWMCRSGFDRSRACTYVGLGRAMASAPEAEALHDAGEVSSEKLGVVGRILGDEVLSREGDDWLSAAKVDGIAVLRRKVKARIEEGALETAGLAEVSVYVRDKDGMPFVVPPKISCVVCRA